MLKQWSLLNTIQLTTSKITLGSKKFNRINKEKDQRISLKQIKAESKKYEVYREEYLEPKTNLTELKSTITNTFEYIVHEKVENLWKNHFAV